MGVGTSVIPMGQYGMPGMEAHSQEVVGLGLHSICRDHLSCSLSESSCSSRPVPSLSVGTQEPSGTFPKAVSHCSRLLSFWGLAFLIAVSCQSWAAPACMGDNLAVY